MAKFITLICLQGLQSMKAAAVPDDTPKADAVQPAAAAASSAAAAFLSSVGSRFASGGVIQPEPEGMHKPAEAPAATAQVGAGQSCMCICIHLYCMPTRCDIKIELGEGYHVATEACMAGLIRGSRIGATPQLVHACDSADFPMARLVPEETQDIFALFCSLEP